MGTRDTSCTVLKADDCLRHFILEEEEDDDDERI